MASPSGSLPESVMPTGVSSLVETVWLLVVGAEFVRAQHAELTALDWLIRDGHLDGAPVEHVVAKAPYPPEIATVAVRRGYAELAGRA